MTMISLLNRRKANLKKAKMFDKMDEAEGILEAIIATLTDYEYRLRCLERRANDEHRIRRLERQINKLSKVILGQEINPTRGENNDGEERKTTD